LNILFVTSRLPVPSTRGDQVRSYHFLRGLSRDHTVTVVTSGHRPPSSEDVHRAQEVCADLQIVPVSRWKGLLRLARAPFTSLPLQTLYYCHPEVGTRLAALTRTKRFDLLHVQYLRLAPLIEGLALPTVVDLIDAQSLVMARRTAQERGPMGRIAALEAQRVAHYEQVLSQTCDRLIVSSSLDRRAIGSYPNVAVVRNGVDPDRFPFIETGRDPATIVMTGRMGYFPNTDAVSHFATAIFPCVQRAVPAARFVIVGADPPPSVKRLGRLPGVTVTGFIPRIQDALARATVAVAPMRAGSGIQNKVLEAMASGVPVVATPTGLAGMEATPGTHLLVADTPGAFADAVTRLLLDQALARMIARNARALVESQYTWERCADELQAVYKSLLQCRTGTGESYSTSKKRGATTVTQERRSP